MGFMGELFNDGLGSRFDCGVCMGCIMTAPKQPLIIAAGKRIDGRYTFQALGQDGRPYTFTGNEAEYQAFMKRQGQAVPVDEMPRPQVTRA